MMHLIAVFLTVKTLPTSNIVHIQERETEEWFSTAYPGTTSAPQPFIEGFPKIQI